MRNSNIIRRACVMGSPIAHSMSPKIHHAFAESCGMNIDYHTLQTSEHDLQISIPKLIQEQYSGFNVTLPHKCTILEYLNLNDHTVSDAAYCIGAVNTVTIYQNRQLHGDNTDHIGLMLSITENHPEIHMHNQNVMVLGGGGAARAACYGLLQSKARVTLCNRTRTHAAKIASDLSHIGHINVQEWNNRHELQNYSILINTTCLGMKGEVQLEIDLSHLSTKSLVVDIVYNPLETTLLKQSQMRGNPVLDGLYMLVYQAKPAFEKWFNVTIDQNAIRFARNAAIHALAQQ